MSDSRRYVGYVPGKEPPRCIWCGHDNQYAPYNISLTQIQQIMDERKLNLGDVCDQCVKELIE